MLVSLFSNESNEIASKNVKSSENEVPSEFLASRHAIFYLDGNCKRAASENAATRPALNSVDPGERKRERERRDGILFSRSGSCRIQICTCSASHARLGDTHGYPTMFIVY